MTPTLQARTEGQGPRTVFVHGFTQTLGSWQVIADEFKATRQVVRVDLPGHGGSGAISADFSAAAKAIGAVGGQASYVGYSLGGRLCLQLALERPDLISSLVLLGASPGLADPVARRERRAADDRLASELEREGTEAFLDRWLAQPLFATLPHDAAGIEERRANAPAGLAMALRLLGTGEMEPLWDQLDQLAMPVLVMAGQLDERYAALGKEMVARIGASAELALVAGAGHAAHLERPALFAAALRAFFARHEGASR